ncbi:uncharacterized protein LOC127857867 isoform X2 [Dreissena polymorpha]|uniref:Uncharacterized protein n=1 Tax=Dreissena polymorpha TaxID=45954 RepID=A0A9D3YT66_DREPO|nr:uncharacterized protein LOC127857867 isoform X2 [Dreissena polymorpha]XP_052250530.1 uncharacterized protein LOC127857867 isoform X2 [Dreissena polymorpha]XP_052250531.1 uncharacterized protein LOC127857867 isoform X2 [Dreissena polymorpha]XP_052250532.1 uncharacterized protein LOC127857867 isoform X2 [Dreissena polymorpha]KAH3706890.1 hypothetical protein DPMN_066281 [Dreissena polymorpha]
MTDILDELNNERASERCHLIFALHLDKLPSTEERRQLQNDLDKRLKWHPIRWDQSLSVVFGKDNTVLPIAVSDYFEKLLLEVFSDIVGCLKLFIPDSTWGKTTTHFDLAKYVCTYRTRKSIATYIRSMEMTTSSLTIPPETIQRDSLLSLARLIKCLVLFPCYEHLSIPSDVLQEIIVGAQFEDEFIQRITPATKHTLLNINTNKQEVTKLKFIYDDRNQYSDLVKSIIQDVWPLIQKLENEYSKRSTICKQMLFEVAHYLEQGASEKKTEKQLEAPAVPSHLREEILRVKGVYCIGTVYNEFTVFLHQEADKELENRVRSEIDSIIKMHKMHFEYLIEKIIKTPIALANRYATQIENGNVIRSPGSATEFRYGTLGSFVKGSDDKMYAITCAHVVSHPDNDLDVFITERERADDFRLFANS